MKEEKDKEYIEEAREEYKKIGKIFCPYLHGKVSCSSRGFSHLIFKSDTFRRTESEIKLRLDSLRFLEDILSKSGTLQEIEKKSSGQIFYGFIAIVADGKCKVVISNSKSGEFIFRSIIPKWKTGTKGR